MGSAADVRNVCGNVTLWILIVIVVGILTNRTDTSPVSARSSINLGPCTWIVDRTCPDPDVQFYLYTRSNTRDRQLVHIDETLARSNLSRSFFNSQHPTKIIIHGYNSDMFLSALNEMKDEYLLRGQYNVFYVDWSVLVPSPCYITAVHNVRHVGDCIAQLVRRIYDAGTTDLHIIGFSLGGQVPNYVALALRPLVLPRITGLDPALPLFVTADADHKLDSSDAEFVDVIHTNALVQGKIERCGHVDFYMNGGIIQPGCFSSPDNPFGCSHHRAPNYFTESIRSEVGFYGWPCASYIYYLLGLCPATTQSMALAGEDCKSNTRGLYMVNTDSSSPYARGRTATRILQYTGVKRVPGIGGGGGGGGGGAAQFIYGDPLQQHIDTWGKLSGAFNNRNPVRPMQFDVGIDNSLTDDWPYFNHLGTNRITTEFIERIKNREEQQQQQPQQPPKQQQPAQSAPDDDQDYDYADSIAVTTAMANWRIPQSTTTQKRPRRTTTRRSITSADERTVTSAHSLTDHQKRIQYLEEYKRNLTQGVVVPDLFRLPIAVLD